MILKYQCPDCGKQITLNITTIDKLQDEIKHLREEIKHLREEIRQLKLNKDDGARMFRDLFRGAI